MAQRRAQVSAPIELFVAVIIMAMSMALAFYVMSNTQSAQCEDQLRAEMRSFAGKLLDVSLGSPPTSREVTMHMTKCGDIEVKAMRIVHYTNPTYCRNCPSAAGGCWQLIPVVYNQKSKAYNSLFNAITCVDMPASVQLGYDTSNPQCVALSTDPCPREDQGRQEINADEPGFMCGGVYHGEGDPAYETLGQSKSRIWNIRISKEAPTGGLESQPVIKICAYDPRQSSGGD
ncbi:hypothetical protein H0O03_03785 [Candidatus Micrarchaeota archaeon]|nr:hypothetical protein [Candidatus Micrarchaeota archaeon]